MEDIIRKRVEDEMRLKVEEEVKKRLEDEYKRKKQLEEQARQLASNQSLQPGTPTVFEWPHSYDFTSRVYIAFADGKEIPLARTDSHIFRVTINLLPGTYFYKFKVDNDWKQDPKKPTAPDPSTGTLSNKIIIPATR